MTSRQRPWCWPMRSRVPTARNPAARCLAGAAALSVASQGDELTFHDQLSTRGQHADDEVGSCVIVLIPPDPNAKSEGHS
jgi:hypothetical protein